MEHVTCKIQWVGTDGKPTPDDKPAIGSVRRDAYREPYAGAVNGFIDYTESEWFPICAEHARQLSEPGMHHWTFRTEVA
jgi:hypothetical protein